MLCVFCACLLSSLLFVMAALGIASQSMTGVSLVPAVAGCASMPCSEFVVLVLELRSKVLHGCGCWRHAVGAQWQPCGKGECSCWAKHVLDELECGRLMALEPRERALVTRVLEDLDRQCGLLACALASASPAS